MVRDADSLSAYHCLSSEAIIIVVKPAEICVNKLFLSQRWEDVLGIKGTQQLHCVQRGACARV